MEKIIPSNAMISVGVSACLLGEEVRFNGGHKRNAFITGLLSEYFDFVSFCPEVSIGLGVPRKTLRLEKVENKIVCVETKDTGKVFTDELQKCANDQYNWHKELSGYILKRSSPTCGMEKVKVFTNGHPANTGVGIYAERLMENFPNMPVEEEGRLENAVIRENFIQRVFIYHRLRKILEGKLNKRSISDFHGMHKLILMSHDQNLARSLGSDLSAIDEVSIEEFVPEYIKRLMSILKIKATTKNHVNVLHHIQGYLKKDLDKEDKAELTEVINIYRLGQVPLIVPITLLRHYFRKFPYDYISKSYYMNPHPKELMLLNEL